ncbi:MAG: cation:proton antiporter, partial [Hyphomicrobiaceae bacterium]
MAATVDLAFYKDSLLVLATAGVVVPVMHRLKASPVLGYLAAGALLGPYGLGALATSYDWLQIVTFEGEHALESFAELGVVFLLFVIGLELSPERLTTMRRLVFGLGSLQVAVTALAIGLAAPLFGNSLAASTLIGLCLALSSTAMVLDNLAQRKRMTTTVGRASFAVLLFQDLAVIPMLFLIGFLGSDSQGMVTLGLAKAVGLAVAMIVLIVFSGRILLRPLFRMVTEAREAELFMAAVLLVAVGAGVLTAAAGLSMALGGFVAGLLLAETEYRKAIEAVIEPFKGLLLGVFFISVGTKINIAALLDQPLFILFDATGLVLLKAALVIPLARLFGLSWPASIEMSMLLGPGGEFAFILIGLGIADNIIPYQTAGLLLVVVALTMASIPLIGWASSKIVQRFSVRGPTHEHLSVISEQDADVQAIVIGSGRVGRLVSQLLATHGIRHILTDNHSPTVVGARADKMPVYFGDGKNAPFLERCGIRTAKALIVTINGHAEIDEVVATAKRLNDRIKIIARAWDATHARHLYALGVT